MGLLKHIELTAPKNLLTDVENRRVYNLNNCELNVFETYRTSEQVQLTFNDLVITSMVRGKKVMHLPGAEQFDYFPGETVLAPARTLMSIDFPEAREKDPTQCIALTLDSRRVADIIAYLNENFPRANRSEVWNIDFHFTHLKNSADLATVINKMVAVCMEKTITKDVLADLTLKELIVRLVQLQYLHQLDVVHKVVQLDTPLMQIVNYVKENISNRLDVDQLSRKACMSRSQFFRVFKREFGITPVQFIIKERLKYAKSLLSSSSMTIQQISMESGFDDVNNFIKVFKRTEGLTPGMYKLKLVTV